MESDEEYILEWPRGEAERQCFFDGVSRKVPVRADGSPMFNPVDYTNVQVNKIPEEVGPTKETKVVGGWRLGPGPREGKFVVEGPSSYSTCCDLINGFLDGDADEEASHQLQSTEIARNYRAFETRDPTPESCSEQEWTRDEDMRLIEKIIVDGTSNFSRVASHMKKSKMECIARYREVADLPLSDEDSRRSSWTHQEDRDLLRFKDEYQERDWIRMSHFLRHNHLNCHQRYNKLKEAADRGQSALQPTRGSAAMPIASCPNQKGQTGGKRKLEADLDAEQYQRPTKINQRRLPTPCGSWSDSQGGEDTTSLSVAPPETASLRGADEGDPSSELRLPEAQYLTPRQSWGSSTRGSKRAFDESLDDVDHSTKRKRRKMSDVGQWRGDLEESSPTQRLRLICKKPQRMGRQTRSMRPALEAGI